MQNISNWAFRSCYSLKRVTIPDSVTSIGTSAFVKCYSLISVVIGKSVSTINNYAFADCNSLYILQFSGSCVQWRNITKGDSWGSGTRVNLIQCADGIVSI